MDYVIFNSLLQMLGLVCTFACFFLIPCASYFLDKRAEESEWRKRKIASDLGYVLVKKKFLFFKYEIFEKSENNLTK